MAIKERIEISEVPGISISGIKAFKPEVSKTKELDVELEEMISKRKTSIKVCGVGGAGNNTITRMSEVGIKGAELIAINTDAQDLLCTIADKKLLIGKDLTAGLGAGADPAIGREAAKESEQEIKKLLQGGDMVFVTCGLGGGTGTGAAPVVAEVAKKLGALTVAVVTLPFSVEGKVRMQNAMEGLEYLQGVVDTLIVIPNDKLLEICPDLPLSTAFKVADEILTNAVKGVTELVTKPGLINVDFADIRTIMREGGIAMIGVGESDTENRAVESVEKAINNPLLDVDISGAKGALVHVIGGPSMTLDEAKTVVEVVSKRLSEDAKVIWGAQISNDMHDTIRTMLIVTGVRSPQIFGRDKTIMEQRKKTIESELGIKFM
ncbi:MAG: cell division protein FtsZ [Candidatus Parvarchaeota archaeon]|nr:cell division protein FtsZ [Candidatus Jingweiarchaeum tengchongense]MCW1297753.1 cell division protein FtsZ [Candidatus Jingweiarchaeum tengchongense]MCW1299763.1 cell division protein FtsZ [Candidatus Jingweiarchaeum tengchongense]MCW1304266.1 cell division protein FtsZ [Candidatus Jingweiarchaeum tengchongense]MCW1305294.1 cell division protein FtsZ [Candidatus Jingweiarchaeum tengchongense]